MVESDNVAIFFEGPNKDKDFALDLLTIKPVIEQCENLIFNSGIDMSDHRYWTFMGDNTGLQIIDNSLYNGTGYSMATVDRDLYWHGIVQDIKSPHCMGIDMVFEVSLDFRLEAEDGTPLSCDPALKYTGLSQTCPIAGLRIQNHDNSEDYQEVAVSIGPYKTNDWNAIRGHFQVTQAMIDARHIDLFINGASAGINIVIDNVVLKEADANTFGVEKCPNNLVLNGDAEIGDARGWYIKGSGNSGSITMVNGAGGSNYAFHHSGRTARYQGLWQYLDQDCMDVGSRWAVSAEFQLFDETGNSVSCDPTIRFSTPNAIACPMFLFQSFTEGESSYLSDSLFNKINSPWVPNAWNRYETIFTMTTEHKAKESTWFFVHNVPEDYSYYMDNLRIVTATNSIAQQDCVDMIDNGDFEDLTLRSWGWIGQGLTLQSVDNVKYSGSGYSIATTDRVNNFDGISQTITKQDCMGIDMVFEVSLDFRLEAEDGTPLSCDPALKYTGLSQTCPIAGLRIQNHDNSEDYQEVAVSIGPYKTNDWNAIRGHFQVTQAMIDARHIDLFINGASAGINIVIDNVVLKEADANTFGVEKCPNNLVLNGDAEIGDARGWYIKGSGNSGSITMVNGAGGSNYAFHHSGRTARYQGLWQYLDQDCMDVGSRWAVSAEFQLFDETGNSVSCDPTIRFSTPNAIACPMFLFQSFTEGESSYLSDSLFNKINSPWVPNAWNRYETIFTMTTEHKAKESTWFFVHNVPEDYSYSIDDIKIVRLG